jgi:hypothetical protein
MNSADRPYNGNVRSQESIENPVASQCEFYW